MSHSNASLGTQGLLLVGHGTRDTAGQAEFLLVAAQFAERFPASVVEPCFLELCEPTITQGIARCVQRGVQRLVVQPLLLFAAGHARRDIPEEIAKAARLYPDVQFHQAGHLGCHARILELSRLRFQESLAAHRAADDSGTLLLMVGRGSQDQSAIDEMFQFSRLRNQGRAGSVATCFLAMARPSLEGGLAAAASADVRRIVVQPHLLFQGELLQRLREEVAAAASRHPQQEWIVAKALGAHSLLVDAIADIAGLAAPAWPPRSSESTSSTPVAIEQSER